MRTEADGALNIAALAARTGVPADTLRKWERRYGALEPRRTSGGRRRYDERDVERVEWLKARVAEGYRIGEAAGLLGATSGSVARSPREHRDALIAAAVASDAVQLGTLLGQAFALHPLDTVLADVVAPVLVEVGKRWQHDELTVAQEHLVTEAVRSRLGHLLADTRGGVRGVAVLACVPGEQHDLGLLILAIMLRADGWQVVYLGADTPLSDATDVAGRVGADLLGFSIATEERARELERVRAPRPLQVVVGGRAASAEAAQKLGARFVDGDVRASVAAIRELA